MNTTNFKGWQKTNNKQLLKQPIPTSWMSIIWKHCSQIPKLTTLFSTGTTQRTQPQLNSCLIESKLLQQLTTGQTQLQPVISNLPHWLVELHKRHWTDQYFAMVQDWTSIQITLLHSNTDGEQGNKVWNFSKVKNEEGDDPADLKLEVSKLINTVS